MARNIEAFKLRTELAVDSAKGSAAVRSFEKDVDKLGQRFTRLGPEIDKALKGKELGTKFGRQFSASATSLITGSFDSLGQTLGSLLGTAILPGIGTAIGSTVGSGVDAALNKIAAPIQARIAQGIELNKILEQTKVEFTSFTGSAEEADRYLNKLLDTSNRTGILPAMLVDASESLQDFTQNLQLTDVLLRASIEQAADIGGGPEKLREVADALGLIAEKGDLSSTSLRKLYRLKIDAPKRLAEGFGVSVDQINKLIAQGRIRGEVAAKVIADSILREKSGFAEKLAASTVQGGEDLFAARSQILAARGTQTATRKWGDFAQRAAGVLQGPGAEQFAAAIDQKAASFFGLVEKGIPAGINLVQGIGEGLTSESALSSLYSSLGKLKTAVGTGLETILEIKSPSKFSARVAGEPLGEGIAIGIETGFLRVFQTRTLPMIGDNFEELIRKFATEFNVPEELIRAVMMQESSGNPRAVSPKGAGGLMQLMPGTAKRFGVKDRFDPEQSIRGGTKYLRFLTDLFGGDIDLVLAGYNAGEGSVQKYGNRVPPYAETQDYVRRIKARLGRQPQATGSLPSAQLSGDIWSDPNALKRVMEALTPEEKQRIGDLGQSIKQTMQALAETGAQLRDARKELESSRPGTGPGWQATYDINREYRAGTLVDSLEQRQDKLRETLSRLNLENQQLIQSTITLHLAEENSAKQLASKLAPSVPLARGVDDALEHLADATLPQLPVVTAKTVTALDFTKDAFADFGLGLPPLMRGMQGVGEATATVTELNAAYQESMRRAGFVAVDTIGKLSGAIGQVAGLMPQQEVGKKRGFWSKVLGVAAPFLSFIPGVGPLLSTVAGMASAGLGGNWSGVVTGISGGLQPGGVFRSRGSSSGSAGSAAGQLAGTRARGGPGTRGHIYWTGENGPEPFLAPDNGYFLSHPDAMRAMSSEARGGGNDALLLRLMDALDRFNSNTDRFNSNIARLEGINPHDVVRAGARGFVDAMDSDAGLIRLVSQRQRLA